MFLKRMSLSLALSPYVLGHWLRVQPARAEPGPSRLAVSSASSAALGA